MSHLYTNEQVAMRARQFWEEEGRPEGKAEEHWLRAEAELHQEEIVIAAQATGVAAAPAAVGIS